MVACRYAALRRRPGPGLRGAARRQAPLFRRRSSDRHAATRYAAAQHRAPRHGVRSAPREVPHDAARRRTRARAGSEAFSARPPVMRPDWITTEDSEAVVLSGTVLCRGPC